MAAVHADTRRLLWRTPNGGRGEFVPAGRQVWSNRKRNPVVWSAAGPGGRMRNLSARLIVGFNDRQTLRPVVTMRQVMDLVRSVREKQTGDPSSTFLAQTGVYRHHDGAVVEEKGAQVILFAPAGMPRKEWDAEMLHLAEVMAKKFNQETVILEIQVNGVSKNVVGVAA